MRIKKLLIFVPMSLLAVGGAALLTLEYSKPSSYVAKEITIPQTPVDVFAHNEHLMRQILRYGDPKAMENFHQSLNSLDGFLTPYSDRGFDTTQTDALVLQYVQDSIKATLEAPAYMEKLNAANSYERAHEKRFLNGLEQIGLYELKDTFSKLEKVRLGYIKEPNPVAGDEYLRLHSQLKTIIAELYLESAIDGPLLTYIDNHKNYFVTISSMYDVIGVQRVIRLTSNGYAIQTQLQLLPKI